VISNATSLASAASDLGFGSAFDGLGFSFPGESAAGSVSGLGVSASSAPLISAPAARITPEFRTSIAPPTQPTNPSIAPPKSGRDANAMGAANEAFGGPRVKLASMGLEMMGPQTNAPFADHGAIAALFDKSFGRLL